jgi:uncharacterized membrane protein YuzA (DUF378 family)
MFNQVVGDGANLFVIIITVIVGFAAAMGFVDFRKVSNEEEEKHSTDKH